MRKEESRLSRSRRTMQRRRPGGHEEAYPKSGGSGSRGIQIFVKMDDSKAVTMDAAPSDKVIDVMRRVSVCDSKRDMYVTFEGRLLRKSDEVRGSMEALCRSSTGCVAEEGKRTRRAKQRDQRSQNRSQDRKLQQNTGKCEWVLKEVRAIARQRERTRPELAGTEADHASNERRSATLGEDGGKSEDCSGSSEEPSDR